MIKISPAVHELIDWVVMPELQKLIGETTLIGLPPQPDNVETERVPPHTSAFPLKIVGPLIVSEPPEPEPLIVVTLIGAVIGMVVTPGQALMELTTIPLVQKVLGRLPVMLPVTLRLPMTLTVPVGELMSGVLIPDGKLIAAPGTQLLTLVTLSVPLQIATSLPKAVGLVMVMLGAPFELIVFV